MLNVHVNVVQKLFVQFTDALPCISKSMRYKIRMSSGTYLSDKSMTLS